MVEIRRGLGRIVGVAGELSYANGEGDDDVIVLERQSFGCIDGNKCVSFRVVGRASRHAQAILVLLGWLLKLVRRVCRRR